MGSIDRADWHYGGDYSKDLPKENGGTQIGMYLNWIIDNDLIGKFHIEKSSDGINAVKLKEINGRDYLFKYCDEKFWNEDLNEEGLNFTRFYYQDPNDPDGGFGQYIDDYSEILGKKLESLYEIENSWENYDQIKQTIDLRYKNWKNKQYN